MNQLINNKRNLTKKIIQGIILTGGVAIAMTSPTLGARVMPKIVKYFSWKMRKRKSDKRFYNTFYRLKKNGLINFEDRNGQIFISLTKEGKKKAGKYQIDDLKIKNPKKWDGQWYILIFDITNKERLKREALRGKIKELGMLQLQKSVWIYPYDFNKEISLLRDFFRINRHDLQIITASKIENDGALKKHFHLK